MKRRLAWPLFWRIFLLIWIAMAVLTIIPITKANLIVRTPVACSESE